MGIGAVGEASVIAAVRLASVRTGVDFDYLVAQARVESGLDPAAAAKTSSARGLYQFTRGTWLDMVRRHGADHGMAGEAATLRRGATPEERAAILDLRRDAGASASMAAAFARDNEAVLERRLGREANATDLYLAHFLGPAGAVRFLRARDAAPDAAARGAVSSATAAANAGVFTTGGGRARSLDEVYARFEAKLLAPTRHPGERRDPSPALREVGPDVRRDDGLGRPGNSPPPPGNGLPLAATRAYLLLADLGA